MVIGKNKQACLSQACLMKQAYDRQRTVSPQFQAF